MKLSDYVSEFLKKNKIDTIFSISGGGIMHLLDSVSKQNGINIIYNLNEQATGICAESYAQYTNHLGVCLVTTGPGATNAITGCAGAWLDSTPTLFISGQCKTEHMGQLKGLRQYGPQEISIIPMVKNITKYAEIVLDKNKIRYHLEKAVYMATHGRRGPVWLDIPLDIQGSVIEEDLLVGFDPLKEKFVENYNIDKTEIEEIFKIINESERPTILIGHGVVAANASEMVNEMVEYFKIPVLSTWRAKGVFGDSEELFMGMPGIPATRYSNYVIQNSDLLIIIGTRLNPVITAYAEERFAQNAKIVIVDIEEIEINKLSMSFEKKIICDARLFVKKLLDNRDLYEFKERKKWMTYCKDMKVKYPLAKEIQPNLNYNKVDGYLFAKKLSRCFNEEDIIIGSSSGRTCGISHMGINLKRGQKFISSMGIGAMGWCIPSAIACSIASNKHRTIVIEGDGSLQHNIQELALVKGYNIPLKIFILSNGGYASIYAMQKNNFEGRYAGCNRQSNLYMPEVRNIAKTYELKYFRIRNNTEIDRVLQEIMKDSEPSICEIFGSIDFDEIPKSITIANDDGSFTSSLLEDLYPFVSRGEQLNNMPNWIIEK